MWTAKINNNSKENGVIFKDKGKSKVLDYLLNEY